MMEFRFDADQAFQLAAINAVCDLFEGQGHVAPDLGDTGGFVAVPNRLELPDETILANLRAVQERNGLKPDPELRILSGPDGAPAPCGPSDSPTPGGPSDQATFVNFSVEMETGTGKTYVYIRTAFELFRRYGFRKFIVVVPSVAIREGVLKTFEVTRKHLARLYGNTPYHFCSYDSGSLSQVRQFALSDSLEFMVMTLAAFNKASNIIRNSTDKLQGEKPIDLVRATCPVLILDEPQNMESETSVAALAMLHPLFALRYSATHRNPYSLVYRLTPYDAYTEGLVKRIEVAGVTEEDFNRSSIRVESINTKKQTVTAKLRIQVVGKGGVVSERTVTVRRGDRLQDKSGGLPVYTGWDVEEISVHRAQVGFTNGRSLAIGEDIGGDREAIFREQILYTVREHAAKQRRLLDDGIKVIGLFFIDRVDNYRGDSPVVRRLFDEAFRQVRDSLPMWRGREPDEVQAAYFAQQRRKGGEVELRDSKTGDSKQDEDAYNLIMRDKEKLLSLDDPHCFIFSHSALKEGWDNPNVCQICTLREAGSEVEKRQQIGRGVRLLVDQEGNRVTDTTRNILTVVASETYETYVQALQQEVEREFGRPDAAPQPENSRARVTVRPRKEFQLRPEFRELWERISQKTRYSVIVDTQRLIKDVLRYLDEQKIDPPRLRIRKTDVDVGGKGFVALGTTQDMRADARVTRHGPLAVFRAMEHLMLQCHPPMRLTRRTLQTIFDKTRNRQAGLLNPQGFATKATSIIKFHLAEQLAQGIQYEPTGEWYEMTLLDEEREMWQRCLEPAADSYYDHVVCDSEVERRFAKELEARVDVVLYVKLPGWFKVLTPVGECNPDWAVVMEKPDPETGVAKRHLYLVAETKGTSNILELSPDERHKIGCGQKHFEGALAGVRYYGPVTSVGDLA